MNVTASDTEVPRKRRPRRHVMTQNGATITALREFAGLSQTAFARQIGLSQASLSAIESDGSIGKPDTLKRIAEGLRVPITAILRDPEAAA